MYVIEHALLNLGKNKGRNILLGVIILAIITSTVVAMAIYNTAGVVIEETRTALRCAVRIAPRMQTPGPGGTVTVGGGQQSQGGAGAAVGGQQSQGGAASGGQQAPGGTGAAIGGQQTPGGTGATSGGQQALLSVEQYREFAKSEYLDGADIKEGSRSPDGVDAVYYLKQPDMLEAFEAQLRSNGLPDSYSVKTDETTLERVVGPVDSLKNLSFTFLLIVIVLGAVIMVLLSAVAIRERKYEIGVLRAMGMKKQKVALGLWIEIIAITCICFALGMGVGTALSQPVSDAILTGQVQASASQSTSLADRLNTDEAKQLDNIRISVDLVTALEILCISVLLASIAGIISVSRITKSEPIKILMERN